MMPRSRAVRLTRGAAVAVGSVVIAAFSHVAAGGADPGALGVVLALVFAILACTALAGRRLSVVRLSSSVALSQFVFHLLFGLGAELRQGQTVSAAPDAPSMLGMVMPGRPDVLPVASSLPASTAGGMGGIGGMAGMAGMGDGWMWCGHLVAALVTIAVLLHGERTILSLVRLATARLACAVRVVDALPPALLPGRHRIALALADRRGLRDLEPFLSARARRGPPVVS